MKAINFLTTNSRSPLLRLTLAATLLTFSAAVSQQIINAGNDSNSAEIISNVKPENSRRNQEQKGQKILQIAGSPIFAEFDAWAKSYLTGGFQESRRAAITEGENLAARRKELFKELIRLSPQTALERAVSAEIYQKLPESVTQHLEKHINSRGDFTVSIFDYDNLPSEQANESNIQRQVVIGNSNYEAFVYGRKAEMTTKKNTPLSGVVLDRLMAVEENSLQKIEPSEYKSREIDTARLGKNGLTAC